MAKRETAESQVLSYFETAPYGEAKLVFGLVAGRMKQRRASEELVAPKRRGRPPLREGEGGQRHADKAIV